MPGAACPAPGAHLRALVDLRGTPAKLDETTPFVRERVLPIAREQNGFRALLMGVNRASGRSPVGSIWDSAKHRSASDAATAEMRRQGTQIAGAEQARVELFEVAALVEKSMEHLGLRPPERPGT
ncbi:MAG: hypothetical protein JOZ81_12160 [Chloroflexi bacterium]|nr:hypothetical protein [Chloroflexota bacterium]